MKKAHTFRSTEMMDTCMTNMMHDWEIDRTSVIKLALYLFSIHMEHSKVNRRDHNGLVHELEQLAPPDFPNYASFAG